MSSEGHDQGRGSSLGAIIVVLSLGLISAWWLQGHPPESTGSTESTDEPSPPRAVTHQPAPEAQESGWRELVKPAPEDCLGVGSQEEDADFIASQGLSRAVVKQVMDAIVEEALRCTPDEGAEELSLEFSVLVACNGVVDEVEATRKGGASDRYIDCVADVLGYADFPGHDMPNGMEFQYPVSVEF